jgi:hypothetical protein
VRERAKGSTASDRDSGVNLRALLARWDRSTYSWRTSQCLLFEEGCELLETLPAWGMTVAGELWELTMSERLIGGSGSGLLLPTPRNQDAKHGQATDYELAREEGKDLLHVRIARLWPTPRAEDSQCAGGHRGKDDTLYGAICRPKWSTPKASASGPDYARREREGSGGDDLVTQVGGSLNPEFVEWLMGWPIGWSGLEPLGTGRCQFVQQWLSKFSLGDE